MAKMYYSGLVNTMKGRLGTSVYLKRRGVDIVKAYPLSPTNPNTYRQQQVRANLTTLRRAYLNLSNTAKDRWHAYTLAAGIKANGESGYLHLNATLLNASHAALCAHTYPPFTPWTPPHATGFSVTSMSTTAFCISWTAPLCTAVYMQAHFHLHSGFCCVFPGYGLCPTDGYRPSWRFIETVRSDQGYILFSHTWPETARLYFHLHTLDTWGRRSPFTHSLLCRVT